MVTEKPKKRWQNLLHKKCPNCNSRMQDKQLYFSCPNACFFIKKTKAVEYLLDPKHQANICLSSHERETIEKAVQNLVNVT